MLSGKLSAETLHNIRVYSLAVVLCASFCLPGCNRTTTEEKPRVVFHKIYAAWAKTFDRGDLIETISETKDGGSIAAGSTRFRDAAGDAWIVKLDAGGNVEWQQGFGWGKEPSGFNALLQAQDAGYLATGTTVTTTGTGTVSTA